MLLSPSFLQLVFGAALYRSLTYSPPTLFLLPVLFFCSPFRDAGASGASDGDAAGQVGSPSPRSGARVRVRAGVCGSGVWYVPACKRVAWGGTRRVQAAGPLCETAPELSRQKLVATGLQSLGSKTGKSPFFF